MNNKVQNHIMKHIDCVGNDPCFPGIYILTDTNGVPYIGSSRSIARRLVQHDKSMCNLTCNYKIKDAILNGERFSYAILERLPYGCSDTLLRSRENIYIDMYNSINNGYNIAYIQPIGIQTYFNKADSVVKYAEDIIRYGFSHERATMLRNEVEKIINISSDIPYLKKVREMYDNDRDEYLDQYMKH